MPIHFRCPSCYALLSIARRKSGQDVTCPKCADLVIVPVLEAQDDEVTMVVEVDSEAARLRESEARDRRKSETLNGHRPADPDGAVVLASTPPGKPAKSGQSPKKSTDDDAPLFERSDFERLLDPAVRRAAKEREAAGAKGLAGTGQPAVPVAVPVPSLAAPVAVPAARLSDVEGVTLSRGVVAILGAMIAVLLALAFATGYLIGR